MGKLLTVIAAIVIAWPAFADDSPIVISGDAIGGSPFTRFERSAGRDIWRMRWLWDDQKRLLVLTVVKSTSAGRTTYMKSVTENLHERIFDQGSTLDKDQADVRKEGDGSLEIWGGEAQWILGSELAGRSLSFADTADEAAAKEQGGQVTRGPERNFCVSFTWISEGKRRFVGGSYCKVFPVGQTPTAEAMLTALGLQFR